MPLKFAIVEKNIMKKGFQKEDTHHHWYKYFTTSNKQTTIRTKMSHSNRGATDIGDCLISQMAHQCGLCVPDFKKFAKCTLSQKEYEENLINTGKIDAEDVA